MASEKTDCPTCSGEGGREFTDGTTERCATCRGTQEHPVCSYCGELLTGDDLTEGDDECFSCWATRPVLVEHIHVAHAAHYMYNHPARGHDLERWIVRSEQRPTREQLTKLGLPADAEWHVGTRTNGVQTWTYLAKRPLTGTCERCREAA